MKKKNRFKILLFFCLMNCFIFNVCTHMVLGKESTDYKVMIGADKKTVLQQKNIHTLVLDAEFFSKKELDMLKKRGIKKIFSYFNVGSLENFRKDYDSYKHLRLGEYENWKEEIWIDVTDKKWQKRLEKNADKMKKKGIDGLFIDNVDVYYQFQRKDIYSSLYKILKCLKKKKFFLLINGGDFFVKEMVKRKEVGNFIYGVNQETVFTKIDFENERYERNEKENERYFKDYIELCDRLGMKVFLLEYGEDKDVEKRIKEYCQRKGFFYTISKSLELNQ